jgi:tRNA(fMet)-specific endonuclease VapC
MADLFIAATAMQYSLPLATLNVKHFERIEELQMLH